MKKLNDRFTDRIFSLGASIALLCVVMTIAFPGQFATVDNVSQLLLNLSIDTIVAVGMMVLMIAGMFDLSVGSVVAFSGGLAAFLMHYHHVQFLPAIAAALSGSMAIGFINGWLIARIGINPMIQTLAMMGIVRGLALMLSGAGIQNFSYGYIVIGQSKLLGLQAPVWYMIIIVLLFGFFVKNTSFFRRYYFIGGNQKAAKLSGIQVAKMKVWAFVISATLAGIAGIVLSSRLNAAISTSGRGMEMRVITAVILGGASLSGGVGKIWGAFLGALFMAIVNNLLILSRVSGYWQEVILGLILIMAVSIDQLILKKLEK
jgi:ribose transport system permease protein